VLPTTECEWHHTHQHQQHGDPEPTEDGGLPPDDEEEHPHRGDRDLEREQDQPEAKDCALLPAGEPDGNGGLVGITNAGAALDCTPDSGLGGGVKAILEGKSPLGVASLQNPVVHRVMLYRRMRLPAEDGRRRRPPAGLAL
jgi:hypothetical protein